jgi:hypothetical protein
MGASLAHAPDHYGIRHLDSVQPKFALESLDSLDLGWELEQNLPEPPVTIPSHSNVTIKLPDQDLSGCNYLVSCLNRRVQSSLAAPSVSVSPDSPANLEIVLGFPDSLVTASSATLSLCLPPGPSAHRRQAVTPSC